MKATDNAAGTGTGTNTTLVEEVLALAGFPSLIDYGSHGLGFSSSGLDIVDVTVTQVGNVDADIEIKADSAVMTCSILGTIPVGNQKFEPYLGTDVDYANATKALTTSFTPIALYDGQSTDGAIRRRVSETGYTNAGHASFNIHIPATGVKGTCSSLSTVTTVKHSVSGNGG